RAIATRHLRPAGTSVEVEIIPQGSGYQRSFTEVALAEDARRGGPAMRIAPSPTNRAGSTRAEFPAPRAQRPAPRAPTERPRFTLIELLVVIAIIAVLISL